MSKGLLLPTRECEIAVTCTHYSLSSLRFLSTAYAFEFTRPQKPSMHELVIDEDDDMGEAEDDPLSKLMTKLPRYMVTVIVDQGRSSMYEFVEPQTIQPSVMGKPRGQLVQILYPKVCNKQLDSWECGYYVMFWIKTIIRATITDDWIERFMSTYPMLKDVTKKIRQE
ncbi:hypothetical protein LR48_Vigan07g201200 [Vigna angularis]|uniref:Ubiquitin-like protease family profile domain-containing protein n=1 Tax=Phaseolus angularis TaxID=3914 RepID=A0A0L9UZV3_PHAAN|nr:hypothetical protein LR48_Vigan07g201200 [Vigna angularis]